MRKTVCSISVDGKPIDSVLAPLLISLSIKQDDKGTTDDLSMEIDDSDGQIELPRMGAVVSAEIEVVDDGTSPDLQGGVVQFDGAVDEAHSGGGTAKHHGGGGHQGGGHESGGPVHSSGSRSKGRTLTITAKSADMTGKVKQRVSRHMDDANLGDVAKAWGQKAGLDDVKVDATLAAIHRPYWSMARESFMTWGERVAKQVGATFKIFGKVATFTPRSGGTSVSGKPLTPIAVTWGDNLIEWSASPVLSRPEYGTFSTTWYDKQAATHRVETTDGSSSGKPCHVNGWKAPDQDQAKSQSGSNKTEGDREKGGCDGVTIDGNPNAQAGAPCTVSGIRDGVDGTYLISSVTHTFNRHGGFTTRLGLKQPTAGAGTDSRASSGAKTA